MGGMWSKCPPLDEEMDKAESPWGSSLEKSQLLDQEARPPDPEPHLVLQKF